MHRVARLEIAESRASEIENEKPPGLPGGSRGGSQSLLAGICGACDEKLAPPYGRPFTAVTWSAAESLGYDKPIFRCVAARKVVPEPRGVKGVVSQLLGDS
jgi:hypothetical protein